MKIVDGATDQLFRSIFSGVLQVSDFRKQWYGPQMTYSVNAGLGGFQAPVNGWVLVTDTDITIDCVLPALLESFASAGVPRARAECAPRPADLMRRGARPSVHLRGVTSIQGQKAAAT